MIKIIKNEDNNITYECDCGAKGKCFIRPVKQETAVVLSIKCPICSEIEMITILQYKSESNKKKLLKNLNDVDFSWAPTFNTEI